MMRRLRILWGATSVVAFVTLTAPVAGSGQSAEPGELRFKLGVAEGSASELFGEVSGIEVDAAGRLYVMDRMENRIRVYGPDGGFLTQAGREGAGPGEFSYIAASSITDDGILLIADPGNGRVSRLRLTDGGTLMTEAVIPLGFPPTDVCALGERLYVLRRPTIVGPEESGLIQEIDGSGRIVRTFGEPLRTPEKDQRAIGEWNHMLNTGSIACDPATGTVLFARTYEPTLEAFDADGRRRWGRVLEGFSRIKFTLALGRHCCSYGPDPELGSNHETWELMTAPGGRLFLGIREVARGGPSADNPRYELRSVDAASGRPLTRVRTNGLARAVAHRGLYVVVENPFPQVLVLDWR